MDFSKTTDNELALMLQLEAAHRDTLTQALRASQAEVTIAQTEMQGVQQRAQAIMAEQAKRAKSAAPAEAAKPE